MEKDILKHLGQRIRTLRLEHDLSQEEFADRMGLDRTYVSGVERGIRNPTVRTLQLFARALGVRLADLLEGLE